MENIEKQNFQTEQKNRKEGDNPNCILEGILDIKDNLLFTSNEDIKIEELDVYIDNKNVKIIKEGKKYKIDSNLDKKKYEFKIYFKTIIKNIKLKIV